MSLWRRLTILQRERHQVKTEDESPPGGGWTPGSHAAQGDADWEEAFDPPDLSPEQCWRAAHRPISEPDAMERRGWKKIS